MIEFDGEGLARLSYVEWCQVNDPALFVYRGGPNGSLFMVYALGVEPAGGASTLPPPSLQSSRTIAMYDSRDGHVCHLCGGRTVSDRRDQMFARLRPSADHLTPRSASGTDYPSNIKIAHLSCNKSRCNTPLSEWLTTRSVSHSLNVPIGKGREGKGREIGHPFMSLQGGRNSTNPTQRTAHECPGMNAFQC